MKKIIIPLSCVLVAPMVHAGYLENQATYKISSRTSGKVIDVSEVSKRDGAALHQWDYGGNSNQQWRAIDKGNNTYQFVSINSNKCMDVSGASRDDGALMQQWKCHNGGNQLFTLRDKGAGYLEMVANHSGRCLDLDYDQRMQLGGKLHQWTCMGLPNQQWRFEKVGGASAPPPNNGSNPPSNQNIVGNGTYKITARDSGKAIDVSEVSRNNGAAIHQWDYVGGANQQWRIEHKGDSYYQLTSINSGKCLDAYADQNNGSGLLQWDCHGNANQRFMLRNKGNGFHELVARHNNKCVDLHPSTRAGNGGKIHQWDCHGGSNQQWKLELVSASSPGGGNHGGGGNNGGGNPGGGNNGGGNNGGGNPPPVSGDAWSNPAAWGGTVPAPGADVTIPGGRNIVLDRDIQVAGLTVNGTLRCANKDVRISARWIMVHGRLECGTASAPFRHRLDITLTGNNQAESIMGMGTKFIGAMGNGEIHLHGAPKTSWLRLSQTANPGSRWLDLESIPEGWRAGDRILVTSSSAKADETEVRTISEVHGSRILVDSGLSHRHFGELQVFSNGRQQWNVDTRAEIGLLSRNIRIAGDTESAATQFGGHVMVMAGSRGYFSGVEMERMGQLGILGRYPFHWHMAGDVSGQYINNSSIYNSFNRCITVHGSHNAQVRNNVCYKQIGHAMFLEDGVETGNVFDRNLVVSTIRPSREKALIPSDTFWGFASKGPSAFWISNGDNTFTNNVAVGSEGLGYWYHMAEGPSGASANAPQYAGVKPMNSRFGRFENNTVHSSRMSFSSCSFEGGPVGYSPPNQAVYKNMTVYYGGDGAIWPCWGNQVFDNMRVLDTGFESFEHDGGGPAFVAPSEVLVRNSLFVSNSALAPTPKHRAAMGLYDFGVDFVDTHFVNYSGAYANSVMATSLGGTNNWAHNTLRGVTLQNTDRFLKLLPVNDGKGPLIGAEQWGSVIHDLDGSFGFGPGAMVANHPMTVDQTCLPHVFGDARICRTRWVMFHIHMNRDNLPPIWHGRSDGPRILDQPNGMPWYQAQVSLSHNMYHYIYEFTGDALSNRNSFELQAFKAPADGDTLTLELKYLPGSARIENGNYRQVNSVAGLKGSGGDTWFYQNGSLYVKMRMSGAAWDAHSFATVRW